MRSQRVGWFGTGLTALVMSMTGCYSHSLKDAPKPVFRTSTTKDNEWTVYINDLYESCQQSKEKSLVGKEALFFKYLLWMNSLSGKEFDVNKFDIIPDDFFGSFAKSGFVGWFMPSEMYWCGRIKVRNENISLDNLAHGYGHFSDAFLSNAKYAAHRADAARMDAVACAFELYAHFELIRDGNVSLGTKVVLTSPEEIAKKQTSVIDVVEKESRYKAAYCMIALLMNEKKSTGSVWLYLATHNQSTVFAELDRVVAANAGFENALMKGYALLKNEEHTAVFGPEK